MLRYYRFILLRSKSLIPLENNNNVLLPNAAQLSIQSFRLLSLKAPVPWQKLRRKDREPQALENKRKKESQPQPLKNDKRFTQSADIPIEEDEIEKFINSLTNRGDFYGVRSIKPASEPLPVEIGISKIKTWLGNNQKINAESFVRIVLVPLQQHNPDLLKMINLDPSSYIPYFIQCCGLVLSDVTEDQKLLILEHLLQAFKDNEIPLDIDAYNAILKVWLENDCEFEVDKILEKVEVDLKLEPNVEFYNHLLWRLAELKDIFHMEKMLLKMTTRGIVQNLETELTQIFAASATGADHKAELLAEKVLQKYGDDKATDCWSARIRGSVVFGNIDKLRKLLRLAVVNLRTEDPSLNFDKFVLNIHYEAVFDVIWRLAKRSVGGDGQEYAALSEQILESAQRTSGFFKRLSREAERHIAHKYYYSAAALIGDTKKLKIILDSQRKDAMLKQLLPRLANHMIRNGASCETIRDVANRLMVYFGSELRFYDDLAFAILNYKGYDYDERFKMFSRFVDAFDPERTRPHILLPLLVRCPDLQTRQTLLYRSTLIGYSNIALISPFMMVKFIYQPMIESYMDKQRSSDIDRLTVMSKVLESFNVKPEQTWKSLFEYARSALEEKRGYYLPVEISNLKKWLSSEYEKMFKDKVEEAAKKKAKYTYAVFQRLLRQQDVEKIHSFLVQRDGFPPETNFEEDLEAVLQIYLRNANFGYIKKLLHLISNSTNDSSPSDLTNDDYTAELQKTESPLKASQLLKILNRYYSETQNIQSVIEFMFELRRLFPDVVVTLDTRFECSREFERLFNAILNSDDISQQSLNECIDLLTSLLKHDFILLPQTEIATVFIIQKVNLRLGWDLAVDTWLKFQSNFHCTNGLLSLMKYAIEINDNTKIQYLLHRAKNFVSSSRVNSLLAAAYLYKDDYEKAKEIFEKENENLLVHDCANVFQLLLYLKRDGLLDFVELCLKYTNLRNDEKRTKFFIRGIVNNYQGQTNANPLRFYLLLKKYGIHFDKDQMDKLSRILQSSRKAFDKWVFNPKTALLNETKLSIESEHQQMINEFDKDYEIIKNGGKIESSVAWNLNSNAITRSEAGKNRINV